MAENGHRTSLERHTPAPEGFESGSSCPLEAEDLGRIAAASCCGLELLRDARRDVSRAASSLDNDAHLTRRNALLITHAHSIVIHASSIRYPCIGHALSSMRCAMSMRCTMNMKRWLATTRHWEHRNVSWRKRLHMRKACESSSDPGKLGSLS